MKLYLRRTLVQKNIIEQCEVTNATIVISTRRYDEEKSHSYYNRFLAAFAVKNNDQKVQECDATMFNSNSSAGYINKLDTDAD